jgi:hypothetical protein
MFQITVRQSEITEVLSFRGETAPQVVALRPDDAILTIDQVYSQALKWADARPDSLRVTFDPDFFFVSEASVDYDKSMADDGETLFLSAFTPAAIRSVP